MAMICQRMIGKVLRDHGSTFRKLKASDYGVSVPDHHTCDIHPRGYGARNIHVTLHIAIQSGRPRPS